MLRPRQGVGRKMRLVKRACQADVLPGRWRKGSLLRFRRALGQSGVPLRDPPEGDDAAGHEPDRRTFRRGRSRTCRLDRCSSARRGRPDPRARARDRRCRLGTSARVPSSRQLGALSANSHSLVRGLGRVASGPPTPTCERSHSTASTLFDHRHSAALLPCRDSCRKRVLRSGTEAFRRPLVAGRGA